MAGLKHCTFDGCGSRQGDERVSFFTLPADEKRRKRWLEILNRPDLDRPDLKPKSYVVCSKHFEKSSIVFTSKLKSDAIPTRLAQEVKINQTSSTQTPRAVKTQTDLDEPGRKHIPPALVANVATQTGFVFYLEDALEGNVNYVKPLEVDTALMLTSPVCSCGRTATTNEKPKMYEMSAQTNINFTMNSTPQQKKLKDQITTIIKRQIRLEEKLNTLMGSFAELDINTSRKRKPDGNFTNVKDKLTKPEHSIEELRKANERATQAEVELSDYDEQIIPTNITMITEEVPSISCVRDEPNTSEANYSTINSFEDGDFIDKFQEWQKETMSKLKGNTNVKL